MGTLPARPKRRAHRKCERRVSKRLEAGTIDRLVAEYVAGTTAAELGRRYGLAKSSMLRLVREAPKYKRCLALLSSAWPCVKLLEYRSLLNLMPPKRARS
jgi:hypothetical protein